MWWLDGVTHSMDPSLSKLREDGEGQRSLACLLHPVHGVAESDTTE